MVYIGQYDYNEPYILPDTSLKAEVIEKPSENKVNSPPNFRIYPNPAGNYLNVEYNLEAEGCNGFVVFRDNLGKIIKTIAANSEKNSMIISTVDLHNGIYCLSLICNDQTQMTEKVVIKH